MSQETLEKKTAVPRATTTEPSPTGTAGRHFGFAGGSF